MGEVVASSPMRKSRASIASDPDWSRRLRIGPKRSSSSPRKRKRFRSASTRTCSIISRKRVQAISAASTRCCAPTCSRSARSAPECHSGARQRREPGIHTHETQRSNAESGPVETGDKNSGLLAFARPRNDGVPHPANSFFTMALALPKSMRPANRSLSAVMVRPMSLRVAASSSLISAEMASPASMSESCCGK